MIGRYSLIVKGRALPAYCKAEEYGARDIAVKATDGQTTVLEATMPYPGPWFGSDINECLPGRGYPDGSLLLFHEVGKAQS